MPVHRSIKYVGWAGPMQSASVKNTTIEPTVAWITVKNKTRANFWKNVITVNNIMVADASVVNDAAKIEGPMWIKACFVRMSRDAFPGSDEYEWLK